MKQSIQDIKTIKYEKRTGYIFFGFIILLGIIINLITWGISEKDFEASLLILFLVGILLIVFGVCICTIINRKFNKDLKAGVRHIRLGVV